MPGGGDSLVDTMRRMQSNALGGHEDMGYVIPDGVLEFGKVWDFEGDWMICGDVHAPMIKYDMAVMVGEIAKKHLRKPRRLLIAGDLFNLDVFSWYDTIVQGPTWAMERDSVRALITDWLKVFDEIRVLSGNHERRLQKFTAGAFETTDLMAMIKSNPKKLRMSNYGYCTINTKGGAWRVSHAKGYSVNQLVYAEQIAWKFKTNVILAHEHHLAIGKDRFNNYVLVNMGSLADRSKIPYMVMDDSKSAENVNGFVMLKNGAAYLFGESPFTDWSFWL